jgi:hypothetical protein
MPLLYPLEAMRSMRLCGYTGLVGSRPEPHVQRRCGWIMSYCACADRRIAQPRVSSRKRRFLRIIPWLGSDGNVSDPYSWGAQFEFHPTQAILTEVSHQPLSKPIVPHCESRPLPFASFLIHYSLYNIIACCCTSLTRGSQEIGHKRK